MDKIKVLVKVRPTPETAKSRKITIKKVVKFMRSFKFGT